MILIAFFDELSVSRETSTRWNVVFNGVNVGLNLTICLFHTHTKKHNCYVGVDRAKIEWIVFRQNTDNSYKE